MYNVEISLSKKKKIIYFNAILDKRLIYAQCTYTQMYREF